MPRFAMLLAALCLVQLSVQAQDKPAEDKPAVELSDDAKALLENLDSDSDGKLVESELPERARKSFKGFDKDGDGFLTGEELNSAGKAAAALKAAADKKNKPANNGKKMKGEYTADEASGWYLEAARDYHAMSHGEALLIMKDGKVLLEANDNGYDGKTEHLLASGTKSFSGIVAALMVEEGLLQWDELACETITEWKGDSLREKITIRMLLSLCAGLPPEQDALQGAQTEDKYAYAIALKCKHEPGKKFEYGPAQYYCFGELVKRKLKDKKENLQTYFMRKVGEPLGMKLTWRSDAAGNPHIPHGVYILASEWAKLGEWVRAGGKFGDKQMLKQEILAECFKPSKANKNYGLTWWLGGGRDDDATGKSDSEETPETDNSTPAGIPNDLVYAAGKGKQHLFISREKGLTIVRLANDTKSFDKADFFSYLMRGKKAAAK